MDEITIANELNGLDESKARQIKAVFAPMVKMLEGLEKAYNDVISLEITDDTCKKAKRLRLDIAKVRIEADKVRAEKKAEYTRGGNAIQGVYNILKYAVVDKEVKLKSIETHFETIELEKINKLQRDREIELSKYDVDGLALSLGNMEQTVWDSFLHGTKLNYIAIKEAEEKAEKDRLEAIEKNRLEQERIKKENMKLLKEKEEAEKVRIALELETNKKLEEERERVNKIADAERLKKEEAERKLAEKEEEAERLLKEKEEAERKALQAGDSEKLKSLLDMFETLRGGKLKSSIAQKAIKEAYEILSNAIKEIDN